MIKIFGVTKSSCQKTSFVVSDSSVKAEIILQNGASNKAISLYQAFGPSRPLLFHVIHVRLSDACTYGSEKMT